MEEEIRKEFMEMIKLLEEGKLQEFKQKATECPPVDIAEGLEEIEDEGRVLRVFRMLPKDISSDVFSYMTSEQQQLIAESATNAELKALVDDMFMDDTVDFLEEMPANVVKKVLQNADEGTRKTINQFLNYPENSAGSLMTIEYVDLHDYFTVRKAMDYIRRTGIDKETVYTCYVIDDQRRLVGQVSLRKLIIAPESACIRDIMDTNIVSAATTDESTPPDSARRTFLLPTCARISSICWAIKALARAGVVMRSMDSGRTLLDILVSSIFCLPARRPGR